MSNAWLRSERGMVGKAAVIWLFLVAVVAVGALDAVSIARTTLRLSEIAAEAAGEAEATYRAEGFSVTKGCEAAAALVAAYDDELRLGKQGCVIDETADRVTITLRTTADTIVAGRLGPTQPYVQIVVTEVKGRPSL